MASDEWRKRMIAKLDKMIEAVAELKSVVRESRPEANPDLLRQAEELVGPLGKEDAMG